MYGYGARREADYVVNLRGMNRKFDDSERRQDAVPGVVGMLGGAPRADGLQTRGYASPFSR